MTERLDRIEALVEKNSEAIAKATDERQELREFVQATIGAVSEMARSQTEMLKDIREMQSEVRGLQVENCRILDRVFGSEH